MKKTFILDTNVLLHDPRAMFSFGDNNIIIPIYAVEEIDNFKKELSELGQNARSVSRFLDELRSAGSLATGVKLESGGTLRVATSSRLLPPEITSDRGQDSRILAVAFDAHFENLHMAGAIHRLDRQRAFIGRLDGKHVFAELFPMARLFPQ